MYRITITAVCNIDVPIAAKMGRPVTDGLPLVWLVLTFVLLPLTTLHATPMTSPAHAKVRKTPTQLLGGNFELVLPVDMNAEKADGSSSPQEDHEVLVLDDVRCRLIVRDTYRIASHDFGADIASDLKRQNAATGSASAANIARHGDISIYELVPKMPKQVSEGDSILVYVAYVTTGPTATVKTLEFYVTSNGISYLGAWVQLARRISLSSAVGKQVVDSRAGDRIFGIRASELKVTVPELWVASSTLSGAQDQQRVSYELHKLGPLGTEATWCTIQPGSSLTLDVDVAGVNQRTSTEGLILGVKVKWVEWLSSQSSHLETVAQHALMAQNLHISCQTSNAKELPELQMMMETLQHRD